MKLVAEDTDFAAEKVQIEIWKSWTPEKRLEVACGLTAFVRRRVEQAIRDRHPESSTEELRIRYLRRVYGKEIADRVARFQGVVVDD